MTHSPNLQQAKQAIEAVFTRGADAWNRRDLDGYVAIYAAGDHVRWISGSRMITGKGHIKKALAPRFASDASMGRLLIKQLQIEIQTPTDALVFGRWQLVSAHHTPSGVFTVHLQLISDQWLIVSDHASTLE